MRNDFKISKPTLISCTGSAASDTRSVSPMPSASSIPKPTADLTEPERIPPASVIPKCSGWSISLASKRYAPTAKNTSDALTDTLNWSKSKRCKISTWRIADSRSASGVGSPYFSCKSRSNEPPLTPIRIGMLCSRAESTTARIRSSLPMLPGLIRKQSAPY